MNARYNASHTCSGGTLKRSQYSAGDWVKVASGSASAAMDALSGWCRIPSGVGILVYHRITHFDDGVPTASLNVTPRTFYKQLRGLQQLGFRFQTLQTVLKWHAAGLRPEPNTVVVTFDDGYAGIAEHVLPVLKKLLIPATVFVNTAYLGQPRFAFDHWATENADRVPPDRYRPLSWEECADLQASRWVEIGAHTHTHADFRWQAKAFYNDMLTCVQQLRDRLGITNPTFAFPYGCPHLGYADTCLIEAAKAVGVTTALTTEATPVCWDSSPFGWGRMNVYEFDSPRVLAAKLRGWYSWVPWLQACLHRKQNVPVKSDIQFALPLSK